MKKTIQTLFLATLLASPTLAQTPARAHGHWVGRVGATGLELRLEQEGSIITGYGDMALPGGTFLTDVGGRVNASGASILTMDCYDGAPYDEVTVALTFQGNSAQAQVIAEDGTNVGNFTLTRQSEVVAGKLWDNVLPVLQYFDTNEIYVFRPFSPTPTLTTRLQGVVGTEIVGRWDAPEGIRKPWISVFREGTEAAWNPVLVPGRSLIVFKDNSTILDLGGVFFDRFAEGNPGTRVWKAAALRPLRLGALDYESGNVDFQGR